MVMKKRGELAKIFLIAAIVILVIVVVALVLYAFFIKGTDRSEKYAQLADSGQIVNPTKGLSQEQAMSAFNESFVYYLLYQIKAYNLHNPPASSDNPKLEFDIGGEIFHAEIQGGDINVAKGSIQEKDVTIITSKQEAVKMLENSSYIFSSFASGSSTIEMHAKQSTLLLKGYLGLYEELTGSKLT